MDPPKSVLPWDNFSFFNRFSWSFMTPIMKSGAKRTLVNSDLLSLGKERHSSSFYPVFMSHWNKQLESGSPSLVMALFKTVSRPFIISGILTLVFQTLSLIAPFFVQQFLLTIQDDTKTFLDGFLILILLALVYFTRSYLAEVSLHYVFTTVENTRSILQIIVFEKALKVPTTNLDSGHIINLITADLKFITDYLEVVHYTYSSPISIGLILYALSLIIGDSVGAGAAVIGIGTGTILFLFLFLGIIINLSLPRSDKRIEISTEIVEGIRILKYLALESKYLAKAIRSRIFEVKLLQLAIPFQSIAGGIMWIFPQLTAIVSLITFIRSGQVLSSQTAFTAIIFFNQLLLSLILLPSSLFGIILASLAYKRIKKFLLTKEVVIPERPPLADKLNAIEFNNASFEWPEALVSSSKNPKTPRKIDENSSGNDSDSALGGEKEADDTSVQLQTLDPSPGSSADTGASKSLSDTSDNTPGDILSAESSLPKLATSPTLVDLNVKIPAGSCVAVIGQVGSSKSSFLYSLLAEIPIVSGSLSIASNPILAGQVGWIFNGTIRENILFNLEFDQDWFDTVVQCCALQQDLSSLPGGANTEIGESGVNLSGGQKARISLARAIYSKPSILLLDDPLSAVDVKVGVHIFNKAILKVCKNMTRILVTHQIQYLDSVDYVIVFEKGRIKHFCPPSELQRNEIFGSLDHQDPSSFVPDTVSPADSTTSKSSINAGESIKSVENNLGALIIKEEVQSGRIGLDLFFAYCKLAPTWSLFILPIAYLASVVFGGLTDYYLSTYTDSLGTKNEIPNDTFIQNYIILAIFTFTFLSTRSATFYYAIFKIAIKVFSSVLTNIIYCPSSWFDTTPVGRILNRLSKDVRAMDTTLAQSLDFCLTLIFTILIAFLVISFASPPTILLILPLAYFYYRVQKFYRSSSIQVRRMVNVSRSPIYSKLSESLNGLATIRSFQSVQTLSQLNREKVDTSQAAVWTGLHMNRWLGVRLVFISPTLLFSVGMFALLFDLFTPGAIGLAFSYAISTSWVFSYFVIQLIEAENQFNSFERLQEYMNIKIEGPQITEIRPPTKWPFKGEIIFKNVSFRYREDIPLSLRNVSLKIPAGMSIGIVGRTGSGKSTLLKALFRINDLEPGSDILIDGISLNDLGLKDIRSNISIVPQEPILFEGTIRSNLDLDSSFSDDQIWAALETVGLTSFCKELPNQLDSVCKKSGSNFSIGERQLLCFARTMLLNSLVVCLDEATASVDNQSDAKIQKAIRLGLKDCTLLVVAHRLHTIMDMDHILVMDQGSVVEFDHPWNLLRNPQSIFTQLVEETGSAAEGLKNTCFSAETAFNSLN